MNQKLYGDVIIDALRSKSALATDVDGKIIEGTGGGGVGWEAVGDDIQNTNDGTVIVKQADAVVSTPLFAFQDNSQFQFEDGSNATFQTTTTQPPSLEVTGQSVFNGGSILYCPPDDDCPLRIQRDTGSGFSDNLNVQLKDQYGNYGFFGIRGAGGTGFFQSLGAFRVEGYGGGLNEFHAGKVGIGTDSPLVNLHVQDGDRGVMGFPYEAMVLERNGDCKLGVYSSGDVGNPGGGYSSLTMGNTVQLNGNGNFVGWEIQANALNDGNYFRWNSIERDADGYVVAGVIDIIALHPDGRVVLNNNVGSSVLLVGSGTDDGSGAKLQVSGALNVNGYVEGDTGKLSFSRYFNEGAGNYISNIKSDGLFLFESDSGVPLVMKSTYSGDFSIVAFQNNSGSSLYFGLRSNDNRFIQLTDESGVTDPEYALTIGDGFGTLQSLIAGKLLVGTTNDDGANPLQVAVNLTSNSGISVLRSDNGNSFDMGVNPDIYGGMGFIQAYNRGAAEYRQLDVVGSVIGFQIGGGQEKMRVHSDGNIGIGTTSPAYLLDVNGVVHASNAGFGIAPSDGSSLILGPRPNYSQASTLTLDAGTGTVGTFETSSSANIVGTSISGFGFAVATDINPYGQPFPKSGYYQFFIGNDEYGGNGRILTQYNVLDDGAGNSEFFGSIKAEDGRINMWQDGTYNLFFDFLVNDVDGTQGDANLSFKGDSGHQWLMSGGKIADWGGCGQIYDQTSARSMLGFITNGDVSICGHEHAWLARNTDIPSAIFRKSTGSLIINPAKVALEFELQTGVLQFQDNSTIILNTYAIVDTGEKLQVNGSALIKDCLTIVPRATAPSPPAEGMLYVDNTAGNHLYIYLNSSWTLII